MPSDGNFHPPDPSELFYSRGPVCAIFGKTNYLAHNRESEGDQNGNYVVTSCAETWTWNYTVLPRNETLFEFYWEAVACDSRECEKCNRKGGQFLLRGARSIVECRAPYKDVGETDLSLWNCETWNWRTTPASVSLTLPLTLRRPARNVENHSLPVGPAVQQQACYSY
jgi:hypothetical protein